MKKDFFELTRCYSVSVSIAPLLIAVFCASSTPYFFANSHTFAFKFIFLLLGIVLLHLGCNLLDDYIDVTNKLKEGFRLSDINFKNCRKARLILSGIYSLADVRRILFFIFFAAFAIGIFFCAVAGVEILSFMLLGALLGYFYPDSSKYGLQEITIGIIFGPLLINGAYFAMCGQFDQRVFMFSIASAIATSILLLAHNLMDYEYDVKSGKKTIPVLLQNKNLTINFISFAMLASYGILISTIFKYNLAEFFMLPVILSLPAGIKLILSLYDYINIKDVKFIPKWYFGPMEGLSEAQKCGNAYFMYRFYLARNFAVIFNIALAIAALFYFVPYVKIKPYGLIQQLLLLF